VDIRLIGAAQAVRYTVDDLPELLQRDDGILWVDVPAGDPDAERVLIGAFGFHPVAVQHCVERNRIPKVHVYPEHVFVVLHAPEHGVGGHVHQVELDQFIGSRYLVTVHGPLNEAVDSNVALRESTAVRARIDSGRLHPSSPSELSYAIVSTLARAQESFVEEMTSQVWSLEQRVTAGHIGNPEQFLDELFRARHGLLSVRTMAALCAEIYGRLSTLGRGFPPEEYRLIADIVDQFERVRSVADGEKEYLQGVIDFYRTRTETKMTIAAERLAVIAAVTLPITALSSVLGMNIIVNDRSDIPFLIVVLVVMGTMSWLLLRWAKRQGWW
jgi:magnesium transporter